MKKLTYTIAIFMAMVATSVFAHHPAAEMVSTETYEMITENLEGTPHDEMLLYDMGSTTAAGDSAAATAARDQAGWAAVAGEGQIQDGTMTLEQPQEAMGPAAGAGTMDLLQNVAR
jgi:hypothetical protein